MDKTDVTRKVMSSTPRWQKEHPELVRTVQLMDGHNDCFRSSHTCRSYGCKYWEACTPRM